MRDPDIDGGCIDHARLGCINAEKCTRYIPIETNTVINGKLCRPTIWAGECNCFIREETIEDSRAMLAELRREHLQDTLP